MSAREDTLDPPWERQCAGCGCITDDWAMMTPRGERKPAPLCWQCQTWERDMAREKGE